MIMLMVADTFFFVWILASNANESEICGLKSMTPFGIYFNRFLIFVSSYCSFVFSVSAYWKFSQHYLKVSYEFDELLNPFGYTGPPSWQ